MKNRLLFLLLVCGFSLTAVPPLKNPAWLASATKVAVSSSYTYYSTYFDGLNDYISRAATTSADSKRLLLSMWFMLRSAGQNGVRRDVMRLNQISGTVILVLIGATDHFSVLAYDSGGNEILSVITTESFTADSTWHHVALSVDLANPYQLSMYLDGAAISPTVATHTDAAIYWSGTSEAFFGCGSAGANLTDADFCEVYMNTAHAAYFDLTVAGNLAKLRSGAGKPVNLGADGSTPTGNQPLLYFKNPFGTFQNNLGSGGNFTVTGSLEAGASIP